MDEIEGMLFCQLMFRRDLHELPLTFRRVIYGFLSTCDLDKVCTLGPTGLSQARQSGASSRSSL